MDGQSVTITDEKLRVAVGELREDWLMRGDMVAAYGTIKAALHYSAEHTAIDPKGVLVMPDIANKSPRQIKRILKYVRTGK